MDSGLIGAIAGALSGAITGAISPIIGLIKDIRAERRAEIERKRGLIAKWRTMILTIPMMKDVEGALVNYGESLEVLHIHPDFQDLHPLLSPTTLLEAGSLEQTVNVGASPLPASLVRIMRDIDSIEKRWGLQD